MSEYYYPHRELGKAQASLQLSCSMDRTYDVCLHNIRKLWIKNPKSSHVRSLAQHFLNFHMCAQCDQSSLGTQWIAKDHRLPYVASEHWSDWEDVQADLSLHWAQRWNCRKCTGGLYWRFRNRQTITYFFPLCGSSQQCILVMYYIN